MEEQGWTHVVYGPLGPAGAWFRAQKEYAGSLYILEGLLLHEDPDITQGMLWLNRPSPSPTSP